MAFAGLEPVARTELIERLIMVKNGAVLIPVLFLAGFIAGHPRQQGAKQQVAGQQQSANQQQTTQQNGDDSAKKATATPRLEFEVASIKPVDPKNNEDLLITDEPGGESYRADAANVRLMIELMWKLNESQVVGGPDWLKKDLWDVRAKTDSPHNLDDLHTMFRNMIIDRFKMQFHWDTRDMPMFALVQEKSGEKMKLNTDSGYFGIPIQGTGFGRLEAKHCDMEYFVWTISSYFFINRPVVDQTGLDKSTSYDFTLLFAPEIPAEIAARGNLPPAPGPDFFTAIREQLGLRLEAKKGPVPVMVIDHIEKPRESDN